MSSHNQQISHLFTVRVWPEKLSEEAVEMRFQARHVMSGETRLFRDGEQLLAYLRVKAEGIAQESEADTST